MTPGFDDAEYRRLLQAFPPRPIHDERQREMTEDRIGELLALRQRTPAQDEYVDLLSDLVREWEAEHVVIPPVAGIEVVKFLCEQHSIAQRALVPIFGTPSIVSEVLAGRRVLQTKHIEGLARFFHVSPAAFFPTSVRAAPDREAEDTPSAASA